MNWAFAQQLGVLILQRVFCLQRRPGQFCGRTRETQRLQSLCKGVKGGYKCVNAQGLNGDPSVGIYTGKILIEEQQFSFTEIQ